MWNSTMYDTTKLTVELRELIENGVHIWDFEYPSYYKGEEKLAFERKVTDHFYFRQIGSETVGRFIHQFRSRVREIMPRYIEMYKSVELMKELDNPFDNVDIVETYDEMTTGSASGSSTGTGSASGSGDSNAVRKFSNTPQGSIDNLDKYMSEASRDTADNTFENSNSSEASSNSESSGTVTRTLTRKGNQGVNTYAHDIIEFRQSIIDVDMMIINDLNCLFLGVY